MRKLVLDVLEIMDTIDVICDRISNDSSDLQKAALVEKMNGMQVFHDEELLELDVRADFIEGLSKYINNFTDLYLKVE